MAFSEIVQRLIGDTRSLLNSLRANVPDQRRFGAIMISPLADGAEIFIDRFGEVLFESRSPLFPIWSARISARCGAKRVKSQQVSHSGRLTGSKWMCISVIGLGLLDQFRRFILASFSNNGIVQTFPHFASVDPQQDGCASAAAPARGRSFLPRNTDG
jgi:hypothetical protein